MEEQIVEKLHKRSVKSFMDILILAELENRPMSGYDAIALIHNKFDVLVSAGTVYSLLYSLARTQLSFIFRQRFVPTHLFSGLIMLIVIHSEKLSLNAVAYGYTSLR